MADAAFQNQVAAILGALAQRRDQLKAEFAWAATVVTADNELSTLFNKAVSEFWTKERFEASLKNTNWYKSTTESARKMQIVEKTDPQTFNRLLDERFNTIRSLVSAIGGTASDDDMRKLARTALFEGRNDQDLALAVREWVNYSDGGAGSLFGRAGQAEDRLRGFAAANGVTVSDDWILAQARGAAVAPEGDSSVMDKAMDWIQQQAISAFPSLAEQLQQRKADGGYMTVEDLASNYRQTMAEVLELDPNQITLRDTALRRALQGDPESGETGMVPLWKFEKQLRRDDRWQYTTGARDEVNSLTSKVLSDFGFAVGGQ